MKAQAWLGACALLAAAAAPACDQPAPPPVANRQRSLDAADVAVFEALFDDLLRPGRPPGSRFLVVDRTMPMCPRDPASLGPQPGRCLPLPYTRLASAVVPAGMVRTVTIHFASWNATPVSIVGSLGDDVTYVSPTLIDTVAPSELLERYPPGSDIIMLSAPAYPAARVAVILYSSGSGTGAVRLERRPDGRWRVAAHASWGSD